MTRTKWRQLFSMNTVSLHRFSGSTILLSVLYLPVILLILEVLLRIIPIPAELFVPTIDRDLSYPEIDIKLTRLVELQRTHEVNCFILGSSMADFGVDPIELNQNEMIRGVKDPVCFNMALKAMKPEAQSRVASILIKQARPELIIVGISPVDFSGGQEVVRKFVRAPWVEFQEGVYSPEGWWIEHSHVYRYWLSFLKYRDPAYRKELKGDLTAITRFGSQTREKDPSPYRVKPIVAFPDYAMMPADVNGLTEIVHYQSSGINVVVVEMPVHPDFIHYYLPGGSAGYEAQFIRPIRAILEQEDVPFILTQSYAVDVVPADGWKDNLHLNSTGMKQFSQWLAGQLNEPE